MRVQAWLWRICVVGGLIAARGGAGWAQAPAGQSLLGQSQLGQSQPGQTQPRGHGDSAVKAPAAAPRPPVHKATQAPGGTPPTIAPRGPLHPHKPANPAGGSSHPSGSAAGHGAKPAAAPADVAKPPEPTPEAKPGPAPLPEPEQPAGSKAPLPRFAALRSDEVNMRVGPGTRYSIVWVYKRRDLPVEIEREYDVWRWVRDPEGIQGWVHQATLMGRRNFVVQKAEATLRSQPSEAAAAVAVLQPGVIGRIRSCEAASEWCNVQSGSYRGYLRRQQFWGVLPGEAVAP